MIWVPQIRSTAACLGAIAITTVGAGLLNASVHGEIHKWGDLLKAVNDGLLYGVVMAAGWLGMKSPLAKFVAGLMQQETVKTTDTARGDKIVEKTSTSVLVETPTKPEDKPIEKKGAP